VSHIQIKDTTLYVGTGAGLYSSTNNGVSWNLINQEAKSPKALIVNGAEFYALTLPNLFSFTSPSGFSYSSDNGKTWRKIDKDLPQVVSIALKITNYLRALSGIYTPQPTMAQLGHQWV
jgi:hypothetical protein